MKKGFFITAFLILFSFHSDAQWINSITIDPTNPTDTDTIHFYIESSFPSGPCDEKTITQTATPPNLFTHAIHCLGVATYICSHTDTIVYYQLPPGMYTFNFQVDAGYGPAPCTPGINPGPSQSLDFTVSPETSTPDILNDNHFNLIPNPANNFVVLEMPIKNKRKYEVKIFNLLGKELFMSTDLILNISSLSAGIYFVQLVSTDDNSVLTNKLVIQR